GREWPPGPSRRTAPRGRRCRPRRAPRRPARTARLRQDAAGRPPGRRADRRRGTCARDASPTCAATSRCPTLCSNADTIVQTRRDTGRPATAATRPRLASSPNLSVISAKVAAMASTVFTTAAVAAAAVLAVGVAMLWRLYTDSQRRADAAAQALAQERRRLDEQQSQLRRYEVAFASIHGRGELGERVLVETAKALGLREGLHYTLQADVAGGGSVKPDMVLHVGGGRSVPVDAKASMACWAEAVETTDEAERADALRVHVRNLRSRAAELSSRGYDRYADAIYGTIMFVPSDAAVVAALDTEPELLRWLLNRRVFMCGPTGFAVLASAALFASTERALADDVERVRSAASG